MCKKLPTEGLILYSLCLGLTMSCAHDKEESTRRDKAERYDCVIWECFTSVHSSLLIIFYVAHSLERKASPKWQLMMMTSNERVSIAAPTADAAKKIFRHLWVLINILILKNKLSLKSIRERT